MIDVVIVIVNWNAREDLRVCLHSLLPPKPSPYKYEVWVVDNASEDGSADMVAQRFAHAKLIRNSENVGFSQANNQVINATKSRYVFLLNSDASIHAGAIHTLVQYADAHPEAGIIGPKVLNPDSSLQLSCRRWPSLKAGFFRNTLLGRLFPKNKYARDYLMADMDHNAVSTVDWVSGCAMFIRRDLIDRIGALDERFYMYCEDVDICFRTWMSGSQVVYMPNATVTHAIGRSSDKNADQMIKEFHRSWFELYKKMSPKSGPLRRSAAYSGLWLRASVRILRRHLAARRRRGEDMEAAPKVVAAGEPTRQVVKNIAGDGK
jgi:GT2 family glycosyltransferase